MKKRFLYFIIYCSFLTIHCIAQDTVRYIGNTLSNVDYHHGQLSPAVGVHNIQVFRADRSNTENNWTYNHQPMLAYWNNQFYLEFLSNPVGEHVDRGRTLLTTSKDGYTWTQPVVVFLFIKFRMVPLKKEKRYGTQCLCCNASTHRLLHFKSKKVFCTGILWYCVRREGRS